MTDRIAAGMNRYRAWIDRRDWHVLVAAELLSVLILLSMYGIFFGLYFGLSWMAVLAVAAIPLEVWIGVAQLTRWRS